MKINEKAMIVACDANPFICGINCLKFFMSNLFILSQDVEIAS